MPSNQKPVRKQNQSRTRRLTFAEIYDFIKQPIPLLILALLLGFIGVSYFTPFLIFCEIALIYDFYQFGHVENRRWSRFQYVAFIGLTASLLFAVQHLLSRAQPPSPSPPTPVAVSVPTMGCEWSQIPIHIPPATTIHVIRLSPGILRGSPQIPDLGVFEDISSKSNEAMDWPSKSEGRWMTGSEALKATSEKGMPTPYAFKCSMTTVGTATFEDVVAQLLVDTSDEKRHTYQVSFDPLSPNQPFIFYVVNVCSSGITPSLVQWGDSASVRVLGEKNKRQVPLRFERRNWPPSLVPVFGPSSFLWNGMQSCQGW